MSLLKDEHGLTKQSGVDYSQRSQADIQYIRYGSDFLKCDHCKEYLGIFHAVRYALFRKRGSKYRIPCKRCGQDSYRIKGALKTELDGRWENKGSG